MIIADKNIRETESWEALNNGGWTRRRLESGQNFSSNRNINVEKLMVSEFGTYEVIVSITAKKDITDMTLFAGRRNMIQQNIDIAAGESFCRSFFVAVTPYIPALSAKRYKDKTILIS